MEDSRGELSFPIAPMADAIRWMTYVLLAVPAFLAGVGALQSLDLVRSVLWGSAAFVALVYCGVWLLLRPTRFVVTKGGLRLVWPLRWSTLSARDIASAERLDGEEFRRRHGLGVRIGAGGLWGGFGLLLTGKETFVMYVSRMDDLVLVRRASGRSLLLTPTDPARFVEALQ